MVAFLKLFPRRINLYSLCQRNKSYYITTPIFYANAQPHIGHLYTASLADASARWKKLKEGKSLAVQFTTGKIRKFSFVK